VNDRVDGIDHTIVAGATDPASVRTAHHGVDARSGRIATERDAVTTS
jgi:hypothetical protein